MARVHRRGLALGWGSVAAGWLLTAVAVGQAPSKPAEQYLDEVRRRQEVAAQQVEADVRTALDRARDLTASDPARAAGILRQALADLAADTSMPAARRDMYRRVLTERVRTLETAPRTVTTAPAIRRVEAASSTQDTISRTIATIRSLQQEGKLVEANRMAVELQRQYPDNPAVIALSRVGAIRDQTAAGRAELADKNGRTVAALTDIERSARPTTGDVEYPKDWAQLTAKRKPENNLTEKERAIVTALGTIITADYKDASLQGVLDYIEDRTGQTIVIDKQALDDAQVGYDSPVTAKGRMTVRTLLQAVLKQYSLAYVIKDQTIQVTTQAKAREMLVTRTYYLGDLLDTADTLGVAALYFPGIQQAQMAENARQFIETIQNSIEPDTWKANGGSGTIYFNVATRTLVVRNNAEVHALLGGGIR